MNTEKHSLDNYEIGSGQHMECQLRYGDVRLYAESGITVVHTCLEPAQSLSLLAWLSEHKAELEALAKEQA